jgi:hypothetical protein
MMTTIARNYTTWRICVWCGWIFLAGYLASWGILGFNVPTLEPSIAQADLYTHYVTHSARIRLAFGLSVFFMPFYFVMSAVISRVMQRIEGPDGPFAIVEQMGGALTVVTGQVAGIAWLVGAFRVQERGPAIVRTLYDFGWLYFDMTFMITTLQMFAMAYVFLSDKRAVPLFPSWISWLSIFVGFSFVMLLLLPFLITGPFAWNGLFNYWVTLGGFFAWCMALLIYLSRAINRLEREEP